MALFGEKSNEELSGLKAQVDELSQGMKSIQESVGQLTTGMKTLYSNQTEMAEKFGTLNEQVSSGNASHYQKVATHEQFKSLSQYDPEELAEMSEAQKFAILEQSTQQSMQEAIQKALDPVGKQLQSVQATTAQDRSRSELDKIMNEKDSEGNPIRPDFNELVPTMVQLKKDASYANLPMKSLYVLAKEQLKESSPEQYEAITQKYFPKPENVQPSYGGFLSATMQESGDPGDLSIEDASVAAAKEVLESVGGLPDADI